MSPPDLRGQQATVWLRDRSAWTYETLPDEEKGAFLKSTGMTVDELESSVDQRFVSLASGDRDLLLFLACERAGEKWQTWSGVAYARSQINDVQHGMSRLRVRDARGRQRIELETLDSYAVPINSVADLKQFFSEYLAPRVEWRGGMYENNAYCLFRINSKTTDHRHLFFAFPTRRTIEFETHGGNFARISVPDEVEATWREFVVEGKQAGGLMRVVAAALGADVSVSDERHVQMVSDLKHQLAVDAISIDAIPGRKIRVMSEMPHERLQAAMEVSKISDNDKVTEGYYPMMSVLQYSHPESQAKIDQDGTVVVTGVMWEPGAQAVISHKLEFGPKP